MLGRALTVLDAFSRADVDGLRLTELAHRTGLPKATTHRIISTLVQRRFLERDGPYHKPGIRLFELGGMMAHHRQLRDAAMAFMGDLYEATHDTIHLAVRDGCDVVYIEKIAGHRPLQVPSDIGRRMPLHCTALGKVLLAGAPAEVVEATIVRGLSRRTGNTITTREELQRVLDEVRFTGVAYDLEESTPDIRCVAAPVFGADRRVIAALSISISSRRTTKVVELAGVVRNAARGVSQMLGDPS